jgi:hypothetical protein
MTAARDPYPHVGRRADLPIGESELDEHLSRLVRRTSIVRQGFYVVVLLVALAGQVSGAVEALHIPLVAAIPAVSALELGGIVVLANADVRRRLGERAIASRILSVAIAASAVAFNWLAHRNHLLGAFFAGMSALGYLVWLMHTENQRRDRLRVKGDLPPTTPAYEMVGHWVRHPMLTLRARAMAKADHRLGLYDSLAAARAEIRRERRQAAIAKVLHRKIRAAVDPKTADIAIAVYDLDEIAARLADRADYDGLTTLIAADLAPERLAPDGLSVTRPPLKAQATTRSKTQPVAQPRAGAAMGDGASDSTLALAGEARRALAAAADRRPDDADNRTGDRAGDAVAAHGDALESAAPNPVGPGSSARPARRERSAPTRSALPPAVYQSVEHLGRSRTPARRSGSETHAAFSDEPATDPSVNEKSLRRRVHAALDASVLPGDQRDEAELIGAVFDELDLDEVERLSAATYVRSWRMENESGERIRAI